MADEKEYLICPKCYRVIKLHDKPNETISEWYEMYTEIKLYHITGTRDYVEGKLSDSQHADTTHLCDLGNLRNTYQTEYMIEDHIITVNGDEIELGRYFEENKPKMWKRIAKQLAENDEKSEEELKELVMTMAELIEK